MNLNKKQVFAIISLSSLLASLSTAYWVYAQTAGTFYISSGIYPQATYTVWREGSYYFCKTDYGQLTSFGAGSTNASYVFDNLVSALAVGDTVHIENGVYELDHAINLTGKYGIVISGNSRGRYEDNITGTTLQLKAGVQDHVISKIETTPAKIHPLIIEHLTVCGNSPTNATGYDGIHIEYTKRFVIRNCQFNWVGRASVSVTQASEIWAVLNNEFCGSYYGIYMRTALGGLIEGNDIGASTYGIYAYDHCWGTKITENNIWNTVTAGILLMGNHVAEMQIVDNAIYDGSGHGIRMTINASHNIISGNIIKVNAYCGISMSGTNGYNSSYNIITNNLCFNNSRWGIQENTGYVDHNIFIGNSCFDNTLGGIIVNGTTSKVNLCWNETTWIS